MDKRKNIKEKIDYENLADFIHEKSRLIILTHLATIENTFITFTELKKKLNYTSGNLAVQLKKLESKNLIKSIKKIVKNKQQTKFYITDIGLKTLSYYFKRMEQLISDFKKKSNQID